MTTYAGWWEVPDHLMPATTLGELEYPRSTAGQDPVAWVDTRDWSDRKTSIPLYDARACPPTKATARQLAAAAARSTRRRICAQCGAHCQRPLTLDPQDRRPLCPACRQVARLRRAQAEVAAQRRDAAERAAQLLGWDDAALVQVDQTIPPPTPAGRKRPATAARVRACDLAGGRLLDVLVRLVGPRAHHIPQGAVAPETAAPAIHRALDGRRLIVWHEPDLQHLREVAPDLNRAAQFRFVNLYGFGREQVAVLWWLATRWRGQVDPTTRQLVACLPPGTPDRLALLLRRIVHNRSAPELADQGGGAATPALADSDTGAAGRA
jgi:hypothetical protein